MLDEIPIKEVSCEIEYTIALIGGKWKPIILWFLLEQGTKRFNEIHKLIPTVTHKILTKQLRELECDGLIIRKVYPVVPPKVEYSITEKGKSLDEVLKAMCKWGRNNKNNHYEMTNEICSKLVDEEK